MSEKENGRTVGSGTAFGAGEDECANTDFTSLRERSRRVAEVERRYFADNPRLGAYFTDYARDCAEKGRRFSVYEPAEWLRWHKPADSHGMDSTVNNSDLPIISRLLVEKVPECAEFIEQRKSIYDRIFAIRSAVGVHRG